ncbi:hypothetical protein VTO73DRAFT_8298 [Trametes versicolor]
MHGRRRRKPRTRDVTLDNDWAGAPSGMGWDAGLCSATPRARPWSNQSASSTGGVPTSFLPKPKYNKLPRPSEKTYASRPSVRKPRTNPTSDARCWRTLPILRVFSKSDRICSTQGAVLWPHGKLPCHQSKPGVEVGGAAASTLRAGAGPCGAPPNIAEIMSPSGFACCARGGGIAK